MAALDAALLAHGPSSPIAPVLPPALPWPPLRDDRRRAECSDLAEYSAMD
jgi:hypothetical protein